MISDFLLALFLGFIQGLTEFLPISSSAHLQLPELLLETKNFGLVFDIAVHGGTLGLCYKTRNNNVGKTA